jgi:amino acid permease
VLPGVFKDMASSERYPDVVCIVFPFITLSYILIASIGYMVYGHELRGNIVENLVVHMPLTILINILVIITVITKYLLAAYPVCEGLAEMITNQNPPQETAEYEMLSPLAKTRLAGVSGSHGLEISTSMDNLQAEGEQGVQPAQPLIQENLREIRKYASISLRIIIPLATMTLMLFLPRFIRSLSLIGALFGPVTSIIIPCACYLKLFRREITQFERICIWILISFSIIGALVSLP